MIKKAVLLLLTLISFNVFSFDIDESITGSWFDQNNSGQGINIEILSGNRILVYWYAYDSGQPLWLTGVGTYQGDTADIELSQFDGSEFGINHRTNLVSSKVFGSLTISFDSCDTGNMVYNSTLGFGSGSINLNRLTVVSGLSCTDQSTPSSQNVIDINDLRVALRNCSLSGDVLDCEYSITSLVGDTSVSVVTGIGTRVNINGMVYEDSNARVGTGGFAVREPLTKGIPVIFRITFKNIPELAKNIDLFKIEFINHGGPDVNIDFFNVPIVNK